MSAAQVIRIIETVNSQQFIYMESHNGTEEVVMGMRGSKSTNGSTPSAAGSRWNPTKEQIVMLENLYNQGIRTPSEEQIQQITSRLKAYGHIEGKNVFYWFQNHKARQRQKQKQESIAYFNRFINASQPLFSNPLCHNVVYPPYCLPPNDISFYSQHPNVVVPGFIVPRTEKVAPLRMPGICDGQQIYQQFQQRIPGHEYSNNNHETLTLFPLHPTGILDTKTNDQVSSVASITGRSSCSTDIDASPENQPFFNFFASGQASRVSDN